MDASLHVGVREPPVDRTEVLAVLQLLLKPCCPQFMRQGSQHPGPNATKHWAKDLGEAAALRWRVRSSGLPASGWHVNRIACTRVPACKVAHKSECSTLSQDIKAHSCMLKGLAIISFYSMLQQQGHLGAEVRCLTLQ